MDKVYQFGALPPQDPEEYRIAEQLLGQIFLYREDLVRVYNVQAADQRGRARLRSITGQALRDEDAHIVARTFDNTRALTRAARAARGHLVDAGSYWLIEADIMRASKDSSPDPIKRSRFDGTGRIGAAIQQREQFAAGDFLSKKERRRLERRQRDPHHYESSADESATGAALHMLWSHKRVKLTVPDTNGYALLTIFVGELKAQRSITWRVKLHRSFPPNAIVKQVAMQRVQATPPPTLKHGPTPSRLRERWELLVTVSWEQGQRVEDQHASGVVGLDVGWRLIKQETQPTRTRVATWSGIQDQQVDLPDAVMSTSKVCGPTKSGHAALPDEEDTLTIDTLEAFQYSDAVRSTRDLIFEDCKTYAAASGLPGTETAALWRDKERMRRIASRTQDMGLLWWVERDRHLEDIEQGVRQKAIRRRLDAYRVLADMLAKKYQYLVLEDMPVQDFVAEAPTSKMERGRGVANISELQKCMEERFGPERIHWVPAMHTTRDCSNCGHDNHEHDFAKNLEFTCEGCKRTLDQDINAARNLRQWGEWHLLHEKLPPRARSRRTKKPAGKSIHQGVATVAESGNMLVTGRDEIHEAAE